MIAFFLRTFLQEGSQTLQEIFWQWVKLKILFCASILALALRSKCCFGLAYRALAGANVNHLRKSNDVRQKAYIKFLPNKTF